MLIFELIALFQRYANQQNYGPGNYFSEFPDVSIPYGKGKNGLILFKILPGREYEGPINNIPQGFDTKKVQGNNDGFGEILVVQDPNQFLPYAVYEIEQYFFTVISIIVQC